MNSVYLDEAPHYDLPHQDLHCLQVWLLLSAAFNALKILFYWRRMGEKAGDKYFWRHWYRHLLWIPRTILDQNFDLKNQCAYYMRTKYPGFFFPHPANVLIASFDDKHIGYIDSMFSC